MSAFLHIVRLWENDRQTTGFAFVRDYAWNEMFRCCTLELPWVDEDKDGVSDRQKSRIPAGIYKIVKRYSAKYGHHFHVLDVGGRSFILIHHGNYHRDTLGCILPGSKLIDIDGDGLRDVTASKPTIDRLNDLLPEETWLLITDAFEIMK